MDADPRARGAAGNGATRIAGGVAPNRPDYAALFRRHYDRIRSTCLEFAEPGVAVFGFAHADERWAGTLCLASRPGEARAGVVGRHSEAELFLGDDPGVALRHLLFLVEPPSLTAAVRGEVRFRVLDLCSGAPPVDEEGRRVAALTAEGPVFVACQGYAVMALVTGDPTDWPASAEDAWACLPERVFVEESLAPLATGSAPRALPGRGMPARPREPGRHTTVVRRHAGPSHIVERPVGRDEPALGELVVSSGGRALRVRAGQEALRRGLLVGRYERCQAGGGWLIDSDRVSRVHLLVTEVAGRVHAVDLASTNGTFARLDEVEELTPVRIAPLGGDAVLALADPDTLVRWEA